MDLQTSTSPTADPRVDVGSTDTSPTAATETEKQHDVNSHFPRTISPPNDLDHDSEKADSPPNGIDEHSQPNETPQSIDTKYPDGLVEFDGPDDPSNPKNWSNSRKWAVTASMGWMTFVVTFASSIFSVATDAVSEEFGIDRVVSTLGISLFLLVRHP